MTAPVEDMKPDRVQFLATSAQLVGEDRALAAAHRDLGADDLVEALAFLQPPAATGAAKRHLAKREALLTSLRDAGDEPTDVDPPEPAELHRFSLSSVLLAAAFALSWLRKKDYV